LWLSQKFLQKTNKKVIDKLNGFKKEVEEGASFSTKAMHTQDPDLGQMSGIIK
jgi:peptidyl-prolyl cis-trans isomerase SurA